MWILDGDGFTPLENAQHWLLSCPCRTEDVERRWGAVVALLEKVEPMPQPERRAFAQRSWALDVAAALQEPAERGDLPELRRLLECFGADVDARDHDGSSALHSAAWAGHAEACALLIDGGADVQASTNLHEQPLHFAAREGHVAAARLLVERGADMSAKTKFGVSPLEAARRGRNGEWEVVCALLERPKMN